MTGKTNQPEKRDAPWSLRGVGNDARSAATRAARVAGVPVGQWVSRVIHEAANSEIKEGRALTKTAEQQALELAELVRQAVAAGLQPVNQKLSEIEQRQQEQAQTIPAPHGLGARLAAAGKALVGRV